jgi:putative ABC transport system permease protein
MLRDLRFALRAFRREPAFVAGTVLTFALAIGANTSMFGLVDRLLFASPPGIRDPERVVRLSLTFKAEDGARYTISTTSYPLFQAVTTAAAFDDVAAVRADTLTVGIGADLAEVAVVETSGRYFAVLGVSPAAGRLLGPSDDEFPSGNDAVVLSFAYWQRRFGGDVAAIGTHLVVDGQTLTVVGVTPRGFTGTDLAPVDLFVPLTTASRSHDALWWSNPGMHVVSIVGRLRQGVTAAAAGAMVASTLRADATGLVNDHLSAVPLESVVPGREARQSAQGQIALWLSGVSLVVLLIATANVGTLLQLRAARKRRDQAVRLALGAGRGHLVRQALVESVLLAVAGAVAGLVLGRWFDQVVRVTLLPNLALSASMASRRMLGVSIVTACGAGVLAGVGPLARIRRHDVLADLRAGGGHGSSGRFVLQRLLIVVQVALSMVLLVGAALFVRSLQRVRSQDLGFSTAHLLYVTLDFRGQLHGGESDAAYDDAVRRIEAVPGVATATVVQGMPFSSHHIPPINIPGYLLPPPNVQQLPIMYGATPQYLAMMGVRLIEGRLITDADGRTAPPVVLVNETMARTAWPGESPIGRCMRAGYGASFEGDPMAAAASLPCRQVVGVVRDSRARSLRTGGGEDRLMQYYVPFEQLPSSPGPDPSMVHAVLVETRGLPDRLALPVQRIVQSTGRVPLYARVRPYQDLIDPQLRSWRLGATLFSVFGVLALGIAAVGLFAAVSYLVGQRTREIGVRIALGSGGGAVARLVVGDALRMAGAGVLAGLLIAEVVAPLAQAMLFQISAREPASAAIAAAMLLAVAIGAAALPSWKATRVSPMTVLRTDT